MFLDENNTRLMPNGDLKVDLRPVKDVILKCTPWVKGLRLYRWMDKGWKEQVWDHGFSLITEADHSYPHSAIRQFVSTIPEEFREMVRIFTYNQTTMLQWMQRDEYVVDLVRSNPILLWLLIHEAQRLQWSQKGIQEILKLKQKEILHRISGNGSKSTVQFLRKIHLVLGDRRERYFIQWALNRPWCLDGVRHLFVVRIQLFALLQILPEDIAFKMFPLVVNEMNDATDIDRISSTANMCLQMVEDTCQLGESMNISNVDGLVFRCRSMGELYRLHNRWSSRLN